MDSRFRGLPSVDRVLSDKRVKCLLDEYPHDLVVDVVRQQLDEERASIAQGDDASGFDAIVESVCSEVAALVAPRPRPVINATGVIIHTNIGRAPLSQEAVRAMEAASRGYCNLEFDLDTGSRGSRNVHVERLLCQLTGAEAALVVNNNASGVMLGLAALAKRKEVIVPRGQAVEIGGSFRIPEIMRQSGAKLVEVGTTNCTYINDYEQAIGERTAALLRVHSSNFKLLGFTHTVSLEELVALGSRHDIPVLDDLGSGCLIDTTQFGLDPEPMVQDSVSKGAGLAFCSGDKLLGGPQAGLIVGRKALVDRLKKHPLARATRVDKTRLAGLHATLVSYIKGEAMRGIPVWRMISMPLSEVDRRAKRWAGELGDAAQVMDGESTVGGGSLPGGTLPTRVVAIGAQGRKKEGKPIQELARRLRTGELPVIGRVSGNLLLLDPRTVPPEEDTAVVQAVRSALQELGYP